MGFSNTDDIGLTIDICDFGSSAGLGGVWFTADSVISASGVELSLCDWGRGTGSGDAEGSGVGSEDCSGTGVADARFLRGWPILFLLRAAAATFFDGDSGSSSMVAIVLPSSPSRSCETSKLSPVFDRRPRRDGRAELGLGTSADRKSVV